MASLKAGFSRVDITTPCGISLAGYYDDRKSVGALDKISASCLAVSDGENTAVVFTVDVMGINQPVGDEMRRIICDRTGLPYEAVYFACTHSHTGPSIYPNDLVPNDPAYNSVLFRKQPSLEDALISMLPLFTVALPGMCLISLLLVEPTQVRLTLLFLLFAIPCVGDIAALLVGRAVGGPKLCPAVSPNKTISGSLGGLTGSVLAAMLVWGIAHLICSPAVEPLLPAWWHCLLLGVVGGAVGQIGDLCFSMIKRHCGLKDYSNIFPGHGGMLDRLDSILFMAMVMFCYRMILTL